MPLDTPPNLNQSQNRRQANHHHDSTTMKFGFFWIRKRKSRSKTAWYKWNHVTQSTIVIWRLKCDDFTIWLHLRITGESQSWHIPFIHAGNLLSNSFFIAAILIQLPNCPLTPSLTCGTDSRLSSVQMYVLDSTRATSRGSVRAKMLREETSFRSKKLSRIRSENTLALVKR